MGPPLGAPQAVLREGPSLQPRCPRHVPPSSSRSGAIHHLMNVPGKGGEDLLLVSSEACMLLDGQELTPRWTFNVAQVLRYEVFCRNPCSCLLQAVQPQSVPRQPQGRGPHWGWVGGPVCFCQGPLTCDPVLACIGGAGEAPSASHPGPWPGQPSPAQVRPRRWIAYLSPGIFSQRAVLSSPSRFSF